MRRKTAVSPHTPEPGPRIDARAYNSLRGPGHHVGRNSVRVHRAEVEQGIAGGFGAGDATGAAFDVAAAHPDDVEQADHAGGRQIVVGQAELIERAVAVVAPG